MSNMLEKDIGIWGAIVVAIVVIAIAFVAKTLKKDGINYQKEYPEGNAVATRVVKWNHSKGCTLKINFNNGTRDIYTSCEDNVVVGDKIWVETKCIKYSCKYEYKGVVR